MQALLESIRCVAAAAGQEVLTLYQASGADTISLKDDCTPLTLADIRANRLITEQLHGLDRSIPILSEETERPAWDIRRNWQRFWLVDPLDGTKEFINRNGEFTVNIALIEAGEPVLGVVHAPVIDMTYYGGTAVRYAWKQSGAEVPKKIQVSDVDPDFVSLRILTSRSHHSKREGRLLAYLQSIHPDLKLESRGSSLKICQVAEGSADLYARLGPTSEWDTAAAHAVLRAAGGEVVATDFKPLRYNQQDNLLNPNFLVLGDTDYDWKCLLSPALP
ncbi:MAG: 3'(2'),5'-bisphosphate nucleotidase CysQ [Gammaproteobacteria bacterium]|nr:3'(2'),5'-bisphosphate nucleotidase CysQ [Gammaproteobacteria bacterium]